MITEINDAIRHLKKPIKTKNDAFLALCSLNLLNAAVKKDEYKELLGYGLIKPSVSTFIRFCNENEGCNYVEELCYDHKQKCVYIRSFGIQFSFHNIATHYFSEDFISFSLKSQVKWDGIRLQPIALELYRLANNCMNEDICDTHIIKERIQLLLSESFSL